MLDNGDSIDDPQPKRNAYPLVVLARTHRLSQFLSSSPASATCAALRGPGHLFARLAIDKQLAAPVPARD